MKNQISAAFVILSIAASMSVSCSESKNKQNEPILAPERIESGKETSASDSLRADSAIGDSVDYNQPESPRM